jgi:hypothetical protein
MESSKVDNPRTYKALVYINHKLTTAGMLDNSDWAEIISSKIWASPVEGSERGANFTMEVDWRNRGIFQGYLEELWDGVKALRRKIHVYTKLKQG